MEEKLTKTQKRMYSAIITYAEKHGFPPTNRELAKILGITATSVHEQLNRLEKKNYIRRTKNRARTIEIIEFKEQNNFHQPGKLVKIPVLGQIAAGLPILAEENHQGEIFISEINISNGNYFALIVKGDSMIDVGIKEGDYIVVKQQPIAEHGEIVAALIENEATVKRLKIFPDKILLVPENEKYEPIDVTEREDFRILGKVVYWISG